MIKVAGVMFDNDIIDGGRNRQDILKEIMEKAPGMNMLVKTEYMPRKDGTCGIRLRDYVTEEIIGWIHSETANKILESGKRPEYYFGIIDYHGYYHVRLMDIPKKNLEAAIAQYDTIKSQCNTKTKLERIIENAETTHLS